MVLASVKKGKPTLRKKGKNYTLINNKLIKIVIQAVIIRQRKPWRRRDGYFIYCEGIFYSFYQKITFYLKKR